MQGRNRIPILFYIGFLFCGLLALSVMTATVLVLLNPEWIGEFVARIAAGYQSVNITPQGGGG